MFASRSSNGNGTAKSEIAAIAAAFSSLEVNLGELIPLLPHTFSSSYLEIDRLGLAKARRFLVCRVADTVCLESGGTEVTSLENPVCRYL